LNLNPPAAGRLELEFEFDFDFDFLKNVYPQKQK